MKDTTYRFEFFSLYDLAAVQRHLSEMAAKGWLLQKPGQLLWKFRRVPPQRLHFSVVCFPDASGFDPGPTEGLQTMAEYCARDGWTLLGQWGQLQIFFSDREDPTPIDTDPALQVKLLHRTMKRAQLPAYFVLFGITLWNFLTIYLSQLRRDPVDFLSDPYSLSMLLFWPLLLTGIGYDVGYYFRWLHRARRSAEEGVFLTARPCRYVSWVLLGTATLLMLLGSLGSGLHLWSLVLGVGVYAVTLLLVTQARDAMKRRGISRGINRAVSIGLCVVLTVVLLSGTAFALIRSGGPLSSRQREPYQWNGHTFYAYHDDIPLRAETMAPAEGIRYSTTAEKQETFLLSQARYRQDALLGEPSDAPELEYVIVEVKVPFLYSLCRDSMRTEDPIFDTESRPIDPIPWNAREAWQFYRHGEPTDWYLLAWEDRIVKLHPRYLDLTPERMAALSQGLQSA